MNTCPKYKGKTFVKISRVCGGETFRKRWCPNCRRYFYTKESIIDEMEGYDIISEHERERSEKYRRRKKVGE